MTATNSLPTTRNLTPAYVASLIIAFLLAIGVVAGTPFPVRDLSDRGIGAILRRH